MKFFPQTAAARAARQRALINALRGVDQPPPLPGPSTWAFERLMTRQGPVLGTPRLGIAP
jgi:hypothetical protein